MRKSAAGNVVRVENYLVFLILDFLDAILCRVYKFLDNFFEENRFQCYCNYDVGGDDAEGELSETLYRRRNVFREWIRKWWEDGEKKSGGRNLANRWSDCGCESCLSWLKNGDLKLHVVVKDPSQATATRENCSGELGGNVLFIHGFLSSSSIWTETVFPSLSEPVKHNYRLFAVDLLGFGRSPKPRDCLYTLRDHLEMIEKSVVHPFQLDSFHLVAHSMGCVIALALASKYPDSVKSITLIAPPYFPSVEDSTSLTALSRLAEKRLWPPLLFGAAIMSWYEHLGRCVCFLVCRYHRTWEWLLKLLSRKRDLHFMILDLTRHTHHSAWHTMHNVICGGAKHLNQFLEILSQSGVKINLLQGDKDQGTTVLIDDDMCTDDAETEELLDIVNNIKLSEGYLNLARDIEVMEPRPPEDIYKVLGHGKRLSFCFRNFMSGLSY